MKKKYAVFTALMMSCALLFMSACGSCKGKEKETFKEVYIPDMVTSTDKYDTTHIYEATASDKYLVRDGATDYVIVYPEGNTDEQVTFATQELVDLFYLATGLALPVMTDAEAKSAGKNAVLSLGKTSYLTNQEYISEVGKLNQSGYIIRTEGANVLMLGKSGSGTLYAAYEFLHMQFGFKAFAIDEIAIERNVTEKVLYNFNVTDDPDFEYRLTTSGETNNDTTFMNRLRIQNSNDLWIPLGGVVWHNYLDVLPYSEYGDEHPDWYNSTKTNLNIGVDVEEMSDAVMKQIIKDIAAYPDLNQFTFTQEDGTGWGDAPINNENYEKYGTHAVEAIRFINVLSEKLDKYLKENNIDREIRIVDFAYSHIQQAPVRVNSDGSMQLMEPDLHYKGNVGVMICTSNVNSYFSLYHPQNAAAEQNIQKWKMISDTFYFWMYDANFQDYLLPFDNFSSMQPNYQYAYENGAIYLFDQMQWNNVSGTDWYRLKQYLSSQLLWNVQLDVPHLIEEWFENYFKDAAPEMKRVFDEERAWFAYLAEDDPTSVGSINTKKLLNVQYWPKNMLEGWLDAIDEAYAAIEEYKAEDPALYTKLYDRICQESISFRYLLVTLYPDSFDDLAAAKAALKADCFRLGVTRSAEFQQVGDTL